MLFLHNTTFVTSLIKFCLFPFNESQLVESSFHSSMLLAIQGFINVQSLFIAFFRNRVLFNATIDIAKVEITVPYGGMLLAVNNFF